jgi:hypothetical protein
MLDHMAAAEQRRGLRRIGWRGATVLITVAVVGGAAWWLMRSGDPFAPGTRSFSGHGISFSYPAGWIVNDLGWPSTGFGSTFAIIGTQPWGACLPVDLNCHYQLRLEPSQISVDLSSGTVPGPTVCELGVDRSDLAGRGPNDPSATGRVMRVDGRPTLQTDYAVNQRDYYRSDAWRTWVIAAPGSVARTYRIDAKYRGPGGAEFRRQLDALIASIKFGDAARQPDAGAADCGAPFA